MDDLGPADDRFQVGLRAAQASGRGGTGVPPSREGVGVTIVTGSAPRAARAPVIPRMLGTIPPSRTGSSPLQRWTQPSRNVPAPGRAVVADSSSVS